MFKLGSFNLVSRVFQSPMASCTDLPFRLVARQYGMGMAYPEMISSEALIRRIPETANMLKTVPEDRPLGIQLMGSDPDHMAEAACMAEGMGFPVIDVNIGCPVKKVTSKCAGSALLREPDLAKSIFEKMSRAVKSSALTVKLRLGYNDASGVEAIRIARSAEDAGFAAVAVHGRTRSQGYCGRADYTAIGRVKAALKIPVIGNGDVTDVESARQLLNQSNCDGIMIGRGSLGNPWIYKVIDAVFTGEAIPGPPTFQDKKEALLKHMYFMIQWEPAVAHLKMRRVAAWYFSGVNGVSRFRENINRTESIECIQELIQSFQPLEMPEKKCSIRSLNLIGINGLQSPRKWGT